MTIEIRQPKLAIGSFITGILIWIAFSIFFDIYHHTPVGDIKVGKQVLSTFVFWVGNCLWSMCWLFSFHICMRSYWIVRILTRLCFEFLLTDLVFQYYEKPDIVSESKWLMVAGSFGMFLLSLLFFILKGEKIFKNYLMPKPKFQSDIKK